VQKRATERAKKRAMKRAKVKFFLFRFKQAARRVIAEVIPNLRSEVDVIAVG